MYIDKQAYFIRALKNKNSQSCKRRHQLSPSLDFKRRRYYWAKNLLNLSWCRFLPWVEERFDRRPKDQSRTPDPQRLWQWQCRLGELFCRKMPQTPARTVGQMPSTHLGKIYRLTSRQRVKPTLFISVVSNTDVTDYTRCSRPLQTRKRKTDIWS